MQGRVTKTIKHARALGLFSYKFGMFRVMNPLELGPVFQDTSTQIRAKRTWPPDPTFSMYGEKGDDRKDEDEVDLFT